MIINFVLAEQKLAGLPVPESLFKLIQSINLGPPVPEIRFGSMLLVSGASPRVSFYAINPFFFQETTTARSRIFKQLVLQHQALQASFDAQGEEMKKKDQEHQRALSEEKSEVTRLLRELDRVEKVKEKVKKDRDTLQREKDSIQKE